MTGREIFELLREAKISFEFDPKDNSFYGLKGDIKIGLSDLAAFIDNYFLPRPLFEDGTPVKVGDEFALHKPSDSEKVIAYCVCDDGSFSINNFRYDQDQRVMKPENPEVLDADGAPIRVGDKLYFVYGDGTPLKCIGFDIDGGVIFRGWEEKETFAYENATVFTHKKPDSWGQLEKDIQASECTYFGMSEADSCEGCKAFENSERLCSESQAKDLIRRAKALAGVSDE